MPLKKLSRREIQSRPLRSLLTLFSIVIGVSAIVATSLSSSSARLAQMAMVSAVTGNAALEIEAAGGTSFDGKPLEPIKDIPGVAVASPVMKRLSQMTIVSDVNEQEPGQSNTADEPTSAKKRPPQIRIQLMGIIPNLDKQVRNYTIVSGQDLSDATTADRNEAQPVLVDESFAKSVQL